MAEHSLDPVRAALRGFEGAVREAEGGFIKNSVMERQKVDRARERLMESIMELVRATLNEKGVS